MQQGIYNLMFRITYGDGSIENRYYEAFLDNLSTLQREITCIIKDIRKFSTYYSSSPIDNIEFIRYFK